MTLRISLRAGEKAVINGAVLRAVANTRLCVENNATVLRGRDVMAPEDANTPARQLYLACMMAYIDPQNLARHQDAIVALLGDLMEAFQAAEAKSVCISFAEKVAALDFYGALTECRWLIAYEAEALARLPLVAPAVAGRRN
jgi:flagellar protein FlbT